MQVTEKKVLIPIFILGPMQHISHFPALKYPHKTVPAGYDLSSEAAYDFNGLSRSRR